MEEQYGEHYAQKVEERLLQYLQDLEEALPADTVIDKVCVGGGGEAVWGKDYTYGDILQI